MDKIKKHLPVILLSVMCTLLLVIVIILLTNRSGFSFSNKSNSTDTNTKNTKEVKEEKKEEKQEKTKGEKSEEKKEETTNNSNSNSNTNTSNESNNTVTNYEEKSEAKLLGYFNEQEQLFSSSNNNESMTSKLKEGFVSIVDFIFYDKEIKGYTFKELTNSAKLKTISIALSIDNKIDKYFPDYKDKIKDKYNDFKGKLSLKYLEVTSNFCDKDPDTCAQAKEDFDRMKKSFGLTFDLLKELATSGGTKLKDFYEGWKDK